jgi:hypothetical protein
MPDPSTLEIYARRIERDKAIARRRWLARRAGGPLLVKYLDVVPSVFSAMGTLAGFRLSVPPEEALSRLRERLILTLDSATELLGGFRFGKNANIFAYIASPSDVAAIEATGVGERQPGPLFPLALPGRHWLFAVQVSPLPPHGQNRGHHVVTREHLVRDLVGFYGLRADLVAEIEAKLGDGG